jgi:hypothetical protein
MHRYEWRERGEEGLRYYRVDYHASRWKMMSQLKGEEDWIPHDPMTAEEWQTIRDHLWRRYQRKRCSFALIEQVDKQLEKMGVSKSEGDD